MARRLSWLMLTAFAAATLSCIPVDLKSPELKSIRPRVTGIDLQGVNLAFDVDVQNNYPLAIRTPQFTYGLDVQGAELFRSEEEVKVNIPAREVGTMTLPVRVTYADLIKLGRGLANASEVDYTLKGTLLIPFVGKSFELPLSHRGKFPVFRLPKFEDVRLSFPEVSFSRAKVVVTAKVTNPNVFGLGIEGLGYEVKAGEIEIGGLKAATGGDIKPGQSGEVSLTGEVSGAKVVLQAIKGAKLGKGKLTPSGAVKTPYGLVRLR